ncbi:hypothetical protein DFQ30_010945 [Apophysomyces sp. BC1015]|nr:hypothetical protein DFQ30_010945 [Apophysomyces sp. BC1015]
MLELGLSKMVLIGVVALIVIGPKKLPGVARTAGALFGRAQRYVNGVKAEVMREIELDALRKMKSDFEDAARNVRTSIHEHVQQAQTDLTGAWHNGAGMGGDSTAEAADAGTTSSIWNGSCSGSASASTRKNWRVKRTATPLWYKRVAGRRTRAAVSEAPQNPQNKDTEETFISHLIELRTRVIRAAVSVLVVFVSLVYWAPDIFRLLAHPLMVNLPKGGKMIVTDVTGSFFVPMKVTMLVAFVIALPIVLYQIWAFVAPGLYQHEKKLVVPLVSSSYVLFLGGMAFAYFVVFPTIFRVMAHYNAPLGAEMSTDIDNYLSFVLTMFVAFGVTFEVPIVVVLLARLNLVTVKKLKEVRPYVIVGAFVIAAIVTPPDVFSQLMLAVPLVALYELGIIAARLLVAKPPDSEAQSGAAK